MNPFLKRVLVSPFNLVYKLTPKFTVKVLFAMKNMYWPNIDNPSTYCEVINWMKFNYFHSMIPFCTDKYMAREYITKCGYGDHLPTLLWNGYNPEDIPFSELPDKYVIKITNGSGRNIICTSNEEIDIIQVKSRLSAWLNTEYLPAYGEWFYGIVKPRIIIEEFLGLAESNTPPPDYKMFYFNNLNGGDVGLTAVDTDRFTLHRRTIYDKDWQVIREAAFDFPTELDHLVEKPVCYDEMIQCVKVLSKPFLHVRVDFYVIKDRFYVGELTFMNGAGFDRITPRWLDAKMGSWIDTQGKAIQSYIAQKSFD